MKTKENARIATVFALSAASVLFANKGYSESYVGDCERAAFIGLPAVERGLEARQGAASIYSFETDSAGLLSLEARRSLEAGGSPKVDLLDADCVPVEASLDLVTLERAPGRRQVALRSVGTFYVRVGPQDSEEALGEHVLHADFVATGARDGFFEAQLAGRRLLGVRTDLRLPAASRKSNEADDEVDPDPDPLASTLTLVTFHDPSYGDASQAAGDPLRPWGRKVYASLVATEVGASPRKSNEADDEVDPDPDPFAGGVWKSSEADDEVDPDPDPLAGSRWIESSVTLWNGPWKSNEADDEVDPDPDPLTGDLWKSNEADDEVDPDPDPLAGGSATRRSILRVAGAPGRGLSDSALQSILIETIAHRPATRGSEADSGAWADRAGRMGLCSATDDHGDTLACATWLSGGQAIGEISNGYGDDTDVFAIELRSLTTLRFRVDGQVEVAGSLYDRHGQRLAAELRPAAGGGSRLVETLAAGRYYLRVEGRRGETGSYGILVEAMGR